MTEQFSQKNEKPEQGQISEDVIQQKIEEVRKIVETSPLFAEYIEDKAHLWRNTIGENEEDKKKWKKEFVEGLLNQGMDNFISTLSRGERYHGGLPFEGYLARLDAIHYNLEYEIEKKERELADLKKESEPKIKASKEEFDALMSILKDKSLYEK